MPETGSKKLNGKSSADLSGLRSTRNGIRAENFLLICLRDLWNVMGQSDIEAQSCGENFLPQKI